MKSISQTTVLDAWKDASAYLLSQPHKEATALLVEINQPTKFNKQWLTDYNPRNYGEEFDDLRLVIRTIFPYKLWELCDSRSQLYEKYMRVFSRGKNRSWGTYFQRMINFKASRSGEKPINQVENVIGKLNSWPNRSKTGLKIHISSPALDSLRPRNGPCLQYLQFHVGDRLGMTAVYRNHDFTNKALGNYIGLGQLLKFIAEESGKQPGTLTCFSIHAEIMTTVQKTNQLIGRTNP